jgi:hypothetical protein
MRRHRLPLDLRRCTFRPMIHAYGTNGVGRSPVHDTPCTMRSSKTEVTGHREKVEIQHSRTAPHQARSQLL